MTRDELLKKICPWGTCDCGDDYESCNCNDCNRVLEEWLYDYEKQVRADAIDDFAKAIICELKNKHTDMPIVDILGSRDRWKEKNSQYLECENLAYKIAKKLKAGD